MISLTMSETSHNIIFGPVPSRRLGRSLGIDILPLKTCNLNCVYCELGPTLSYTCSPTSICTPANISNALRDYLNSHHCLSDSPSSTFFDYVTVTASGEPTLHSGLYEIIADIKERLPSTPLAVLTNSAMLFKKDVRNALLMADIVLPSLDAATDEAFRKINRPCKGLLIGEIVKGLIAFREAFSGKVALEVLFVANINDNEQEIRHLARAIDKIQPDEVQLNTITRPPAEKWAHPVSYKKLEEIASFLGARARIITSYKGKAVSNTIPSKEDLLRTIKRRPISTVDIASLFPDCYNETLNLLDEMLKSGILKRVKLNEKEFFVII